MPLIAIVLFAFTAMLMSIGQAQRMETAAQGTALQQMTAQSAKEFAEFTTAAGAYVQSIGLPLPGTALTVTNLQSVNLLPSSFPTQTPFGQILVADYVSDPNNPVALDVVVHTTGTMNAALLQKSGIAPGSVATVQYDTAVTAQNQVPSRIVGSTGQFFGMVNGSTLTNLGSSSSMTLPGGISTQQPEVAEYILSPGQYGYWIVGATTYGWSAIWEPVVGWNGQNASATSFFQPYTDSAVGVMSQGFSLTCPSVATNLANLANGSPTGSNATLYSSDSGNASQSPIFCIPAYKGQVVPFQSTAQIQFFSPYSADTLTWNGQYYINPVAWNPNSYGYSVTSNTTFVNPGSVSGLNNSLYTTGGFMNIYAPAPQYPANEASTEPAPNGIIGGGVSLSVKTPQNTTVTYQIEVDMGSLFTGPGCPEWLVDPWTQAGALYHVWANGTGGSNQNLCGSQETFWNDWHAVKDSGNTGSMPVSQPYESGGTNYMLNFSVATPAAN